MPPKKSAAEEANVPKDIQFSARDYELLATAFQCVKGEPIAIDYQKYAELANFKNSASAKASWHGLKKKIDKVAAAAQAKKGAQDAEGTAGAADDTDNSDAPDADDAPVEAPTKKSAAKAGKKTAAATKKGGKSGAKDKAPAAATGETTESDDADDDEVKDEKKKPAPAKANAGMKRKATVKNEGDAEEGEEKPVPAKKGKVAGKAAPKETAAAKKGRVAKATKATKAAAKKTPEPVVDSDSDNSSLSSHAENSAKTEAATDSED